MHVCHSSDLSKFSSGVCVEFNVEKMHSELCIHPLVGLTEKTSSWQT